MEKTFISDVQNKLIKNLSKGYKQRVGLAQAILGNPSIIILDEPTVGLDPKQILEIRELILDLKKEHTVILSSHILSEVSAVCDEIMIISKGEMIACDTPEGLSHLMQGEDALELQIKGSAKRLQEVLEDIEGVRSFEIDTKEKSELVCANIVVEKGKEIREELFQYLAKEQLPIYQLQINTKSLEDIFLELTSGEAKAIKDKTVDEISESTIAIKENEKEEE